MANRRDGGLVIIGVDSDTLDPVGFDEDEVEPWLNYDELAEKVNEFASPSVSFDMAAHIFRSRRFVIIRVHEFEDIPILCSRDFQRPGKGKEAPILRRGLAMSGLGTSRKRRRFRPKRRCANCWNWRSTRVSENS